MYRYVLTLVITLLIAGCGPAQSGMPAQVQSQPVQQEAVPPLQTCTSSIYGEHDLTSIVIDNTMCESGSATNKLGPVTVTNLQNRQITVTRPQESASLQPGQAYTFAAQNGEVYWR